MCLSYTYMHAALLAVLLIHNFCVTLDALTLHLEFSVASSWISCSCVLSYLYPSGEWWFTTMYYRCIDLDHGTSTAVLCDVYSCCPISTWVLMCNTNSLDTSSGLSTFLSVATMFSRNHMTGNIQQVWLSWMTLTTLYRAAKHLMMSWCEQLCPGVNKRGTIDAINYN